MVGDADPQVDVNVLIRLLNGEPEFVTYVTANRAVGQSYTLAAQEEFLATGAGTTKELQDLENQYDIRLRMDPSLVVLDLAAARLMAAFHGDRLGRILHPADARVAAGAFVMTETLATGDLQLFKRCRDLGLSVEFIGSAPATTKANAYVPQRLGIPPP